MMLKVEDLVSRIAYPTEIVITRTVLNGTTGVARIESETIWKGSCCDVPDGLLQWYVHTLKVIDGNTVELRIWKD